VNRELTSLVESHRLDVELLLPVYVLETDTGRGSVSRCPEDSGELDEA
jgi:hypothetical protein